MNLTQSMADPTFVVASMDFTQGLEIATFIIAVVVAGQTSSIGKSRAKIIRLEKKVDLILQHLGIDAIPPLEEKVLNLLKVGQKIEAIKMYREQSGADLQEAKSFVENLKDRSDN